MFVFYIFVFVLFIRLFVHFINTKTDYDFRIIDDTINKLHTKIKNKYNIF